MIRREVLERAAKAAGMTLADYQGGGDDAPNGLWMARGYANPITGSRDWNPLADDGDALRLAVLLGIDLRFCGIEKLVEARHQNTSYGQCIEYGDDKFATTRNAIVRAAAEIGKAMP